MFTPPRWLRAAALPVAVAAAVTGAAPGFIHVRVQRGDTLSAIAARLHTTVAALVALNRLPGNGNLIYAGQLLDVPCSPSVLAHRVIAGDTVDALASRYGIPPATVSAANRLPASGLIRIGATLVIPVSRCPTATPATTVPATAGGPSRTTMRSLIAAAARRLGVDPALAEAISWQEAGFNQAEVSPAGAIGAMQVTPATGAFVSRYVLGRRLNLYDGADNALAGVAFLKTLLGVAPVEQAVAAYYQGLASVRSHGQFADTRQYVADVLALRQRFGG